MSNAYRQKIEGRHNIKQIYQTVKAKFKVYKGNITYKHFKEFQNKFLSRIRTNKNLTSHDIYEA